MSENVATDTKQQENWTNWLMIVYSFELFVLSLCWKVSF